jgi:hypothetical protein
MYQYSVAYTMNTSRRLLAASNELLPRIAEIAAEAATVSTGSKTTAL